MSHWTRASIASSLLALSLLAAGCGERTYSAAEVRDAFGGTTMDFAHVGDDPPPVRPLDPVFRALRSATSAPITRAPSIPAPSAALIGADELEVLVYPTASRARAAERAYEWAARHANEIAAELRREFPHASEMELERHVAASRRANVVAIYQPAAEDRVEAAST